MASVIASPVPPPVDGSSTVIPGLVDFHAAHNPLLPWALLAAPETATPAGSISWREFAEATHRVAHALRPNRAGPDNAIVALLINCDTVYYLALIAGLIRAGFIPFPLSHRNSASAVVSLLKQTSCHRMISQPSFSSLLSHVQHELSVESWGLMVEDLPDIETIFPVLYGKDREGLFVPYPARDSIDKHDVAFYIHSSGSTGFPKPVPQRFVNMLEVSNCPILRDSRARGIVWGPMALPPFHVMGIYTMLYGPLASGLPVGLFAPRAPASPLVPTPQITLRACLAIGCTGIPTVPAFIDAWAKNEDDLKLLKTLQIIAFAGGPLASKTGAALVAVGAPLYPWYGATEFGPPTRVFDLATDVSAVPDAKTLSEWEWVQFGDYVRPRWEPQGDGTYELQLLTCETHHPSIENLPDCRGYATNDLFQPHPTRSGLWRVTGRKDDVLVLGSGEKVVPIPQEGVIGSSRMVNAAVMFGRGKSQCGVLIELDAEYVAEYSIPEALPKIRNVVWPVIEEANHSAPAFARIFKEMVIVVDPARPLPRAGKGTVMRKQALQMYETDIEELYARVESSTTSNGITPPKTWSPADVETWLVVQASSIVSSGMVKPYIDVFDQGFDSLHATFLRNRIIGALRSDPDPDIATRAAHNVSQNFVFEYPMLRELAFAVAALAESGTPDATRVRTAEQQIVDMIEKYTADLAMPVCATAPGGEGARRVVVLLTGSTGNVGSQLLASMLSNQKIAQIYTLNRWSAQTHNRQKTAFLERGLDARLLDDPRLTQLVGGVTKENFGLTPETYAEVRNVVTHVLHNAWRVDFNLSLQSFEAHVAGTRKLVDFCCAIDRPVKLLFTSSISEARNWDVSIGPVPEDPIPGAEVATANGYGSSKYVAGQVLAKAAVNGLQCTSLRLGQVCGSKMTGAWSTTEWFPILVKSSMSLGLLPDFNGLVSWIPADAVADAMIDLVMSKDPLPPFLNLVHPHPVSWNVVRDSLRKHLAPRTLAIIPLCEWLDKVEQLPAEDGTINKVPAIKLLEYYRGLAEGEQRFAKASKTLSVEIGGWPVFGTRRIQQYSPSLRDLDVLGDAHAEAWIGYWKHTGFLHSVG